MAYGGKREVFTEKVADIHCIKEKENAEYLIHSCCKSIAPPADNFYI
jgi:hypothetical protein